MKKHYFLFLFASAQILSNAQTGLSGYWIDTLDIGLRFVLHFHQQDTLFALDFYSIDQSKNGVPMKNWYRENDSIFAKDKKTNLNFSLKYDSLNNKISGKLKQGINETSLNFRPIDSFPKILRPQTPQPPFPYKIEEVTFTNKAAKITLSGTLTVPEKGENFKAIVLLHGSGPHDRDETIYDHKLLWILADSLTRQGYAVLRYDKRGIGKSKGSYVKASVSDLYEDACAAIEFLRNDKRIDKNGIGVIGHSEGGTIAPIIAANDKKIAFIVSLAGSVQRGRELLLDQSRLVQQSVGVGEDTIAITLRLNTFLYDEVIKNGKSKDFATKLKTALDNYELTLSEQEKAILSWGTILRTTIALQLTPWMVEFIALSPQKYIAKVKCPVLAIFGEKDIQVPAHKNAELMLQSLQKTKNEQHSKVEIVKGTNHLLQRCNLCTVKEYSSIEETIAPEVLELIFSWLREKN